MKSQKWQVQRAYFVTTEIVFLSKGLGNQLFEAPKVIILAKITGP